VSSCIIRLRKRDERGVTIVEAAFVLPVLFIFIFGLIDLGMLVFKTTQASNGARDGARVGIIRYDGVTGNCAPGTYSAGSDCDAIVKAIQARLGGQTFTPTVTCVGPTTTTAISCATARAGRDRINVQIQWPQASLTFVGQKALGASRNVTGSAVMVLVGEPQ
jgi:Flp pilus assembly protein TadG